MVPHASTNTSKGVHSMEHWIDPRKAIKETVQACSSAGAGASSRGVPFAVNGLGMTSSETSAFQKGIVTMLTQRAGSGADATGVATAVRSAYDDLAAALVPLISHAGVDALVARAFHLAQREYPLDQAGEEQPAEPFAQVLRWVERQDDPTLAADAAATMLATFAGMLAALIGEPLTTRYLRKAWADGFSAASAGGKQA
jgi:hypothetical protein